MNIKLKAGLYTAGIVTAIIAGITLALISPQTFATIVMFAIACGLVNIIYNSVLHDLKRRVTLESNEDTTKC